MIKKQLSKKIVLTCLFFFIVINAIYCCKMTAKINYLSDTQSCHSTMSKEHADDSMHHEAMTARKNVVCHNDKLTVNDCTHCRLNKKHDYIINAQQYESFIVVYLLPEAVDIVTPPVVTLNNDTPYHDSSHLTIIETTRLIC